jgi:hypothetical protein
MPPKKITAPEAALQPLDTNQETLSLSEKPEAKRERPPIQYFRRRSWTRRSGTWRSSTSRCKGKKEKMARLADLHRKIDEATEEVRHLTQDDHDRRPQHRELRCWGKGEDATLRSSFRLSRCANRCRRTGEVHPSPCTLRHKGLRRRRPVPRPHSAWRPTWDSAHCNRPRKEKRVTGPICNSFSVMTVCNPPL